MSQLFDDWDDEDKMTKKNPYIEEPSKMEIIGWAALLAAFIWLLLFGFTYITRGVSWLITNFT